MHALSTPTAAAVFRFLCFFSSRRRHTRYWRDWSSDVCSSDLTGDEIRRTVENVLNLLLAKVGLPRHEAVSEIITLLLVKRSEERRVGKECRSRWSLYH